ncbi:MAG: hypothetical protein AB1558_06225 [Thermodesulfobacteriota bacterium]
MMRKRAMGYLFVVALTFLGAGLLPARSAAQDTPEGMDFPRQYLVELSGTVMNETFSGAQALLTLKQATGGPTSNPFALTIESYPDSHARNSFFWDSRYSEMTAIANDITCHIKQAFLRTVPMHFFFLASEGQKQKGRAFEDEPAVLNAAPPTLIPARAGQLKLRIHSNTVSGTVWMKGYDPAEKAFILYSARLYGKKTYHLKPKQGTKAGSSKPRD